MSGNNLELDHPCKQTCSGWQQGYERGMAELEQENEALRAALKVYAKPTNWNTLFYIFTALSPGCAAIRKDDIYELAPGLHVGGKAAKEVLAKYSK